MRPVNTLLYKDQMFSNRFLMLLLRQLIIGQQGIANQGGRFVYFPFNQGLPCASGDLRPTESTVPAYYKHRPGILFALLSQLKNSSIISTSHTTHPRR
jgi:hypothetical protein